jgi:hypothetical protein
VGEGATRAPDEETQRAGNASREDNESTSGSGWLHKSSLYLTMPLPRALCTRRSPHEIGNTAKQGRSTRVEHGACLKDTEESGLNVLGVVVSGWQMYAPPPSPGNTKDTRKPVRICSP